MTVQSPHSIRRRVCAMWKLNYIILCLPLCVRGCAPLCFSHYTVRCVDRDGRWRHRREHGAAAAGFRLHAAPLLGVSLLEIWFQSDGENGRPFAFERFRASDRIHALYMNVGDPQRLAHALEFHVDGQQYRPRECGGLDVDDQDPATLLTTPSTTHRCSLCERKHYVCSDVSL